MTDNKRTLEEQTFLKFHLFKTPILENGSKIGYYAIEYDLDFE